MTKTKRWKALRLQALRRDRWRCPCGAPAREVDHVLPVRTHPELSYELSNLRSLCSSCHSRKTITEIGLSPLSPERRKWRELLKT
ncbi:HNH endonuclease [Methyloceanibacter marginalis]|uniref:HNH endonuclease n=1 Tax=Methyloceanibacter marginalis TaxID=1774971 RepID=UPI003CC7ADF6